MCGWIASLTCDVGPGLALLQHRGIRSRKVNTRCGASVGHVRLPIVGLDERWDQPWQEGTGSRTLVFSGEILNFRDYADAECDLPLVSDTWAIKGPEGFKDFDGFWSIGVVDDHHETLHVLCDYLAQKPTYYREDVAAAASEPDALAALAPVTPDDIYFASVIKWGYCPEIWRTPYQEIFKVMPGEHVVLTETGCRRRIADKLQARPWDLRREIEDAVKRRVLSSDVPVACLLSGGLDSSIVYTLAKQHAPVRAYFADSDDLDEQLRVSAVAGDDPVKKIFWNLVSQERAARCMQEPIDLGSLIPQMALSDQVKERVCLTGDGADEVFGGYGRSMRYDSQASDIFHELVAWHLPRLDRIMMRNRVEVRSPFLARRVVEAGMFLPWHQRRDKAHLRMLFAGDLPPGVAEAKKKPLRTKTVEDNREAVSAKMVEDFRRQRWPKTLVDRMKALA